MAGNIFREKSMQRVSSPEQLNDYIKVTNPGIWITLGAVMILLIGLIVWGSSCRIESRLDSVVLSLEDIGGLEGLQGTGINDITFCFVREADISQVSQDDLVMIDGKEYPIELISDEPMTVSPDTFSEYAMHLCNLMEGEWVYPIKIDTKLPQGTYKATIVTDSVSPIMFLLN